jgi:phosphatidylserine/phosphatidylglycerophosphate/cardiolipin synthase-like enzyme
LVVVVGVSTRHDWLSFEAKGARMVAGKKAKSAKAKAAAKTKGKPKTKSGSGAVRRSKSPARKARSKPAAKTKPKTAPPPRSKTLARSKPRAPATTPPKPAVSVPRPATPATSNPQASAPSGFQVEGTNGNAPFTLKLHRGEGMTLVAMNWKNGQPPQDFVGFAIEYQEPGGSQYYALNNRLGLLDAAGNVDPTALSTLQSPIQKFRWVHFPSNADLVGDFKYRVTPMFMDAQDQLSTGERQEVAIQLARETYPGIANVTFTRGFVSSQAFVDRYIKDGPINTLVAPLAAKGLDFTSTHPDSTAALAWMGFEARAAIIETLDQAIADKAEVRVIAYDFNLPEVVDRLERLGSSLKIIIDDSKGHGGAGTAETEAEGRMVASAGRANVLRQHMGSLQHNKTIAVNGATVKKVVCGSTNLSWRGFFVQANNAFVLTGQTAVDLFFAAFDSYFKGAKNDVAGFGAKPSADWNDLGLAGIDAKVAFSPHNAANAKLGGIAADIKTNTTSSLLYSLAFLYETPGVVLDAIKVVTADDNIFVYGISDKKVGGLDVQDPSGNVAPVYAAELGADVPEPFKSEPTGGTGTRMHHKFTVIDFDKSTARVYLGSYNFSTPADLKNGENLVIVRDRRIAVSYMIEALSLFDHYSFRVAQKTAAAKGQKLHLSRPPRAADEKPWWDDDYTVAHKIKDRVLFS